MAASAEHLKLILGLKLKKFRQEKGLSLIELAGATGFSVSYLSEIEKGKKYPKPDKLIQLAASLQIPYDDLVSLKVDDSLNPITSFLQSETMKGVPFGMFGFSPADVVNLFSQSPTQAAAFIRTLLEIGQSYDLQVEKFLFATLRIYQKMHHNYFPEIETAAQNFLKDHPQAANPTALRNILEEEFKTVVDESRLAEDPLLNGFRTVWLDGNPRQLLLNSRLTDLQKNFLLGREIGFNVLQLKQRPRTSSWLKVNSFDEVLNNFNASYFSGALLLEYNRLGKDIADFFAKPLWDADGFLKMMHNYHATPEMFIYRLSQVVPAYLGLEDLFYLRFSNRRGSGRFRLTKELNLSRKHAPHGLDLNEHYCRRWHALSMLKELNLLQKKDNPPVIVAGAQRIRFLESQAEFFTITLARPLELQLQTNSSITLGFLLDEKFSSTVQFARDPAVPFRKVNETCERCPLSKKECTERAAAPSLFQQSQRQEKQMEALQKLQDQIQKK